MENKVRKWGELSSSEGYGRLFFNLDRISAVTQSQDGKELRIVTGGYTAAVTYPNVEGCAKAYDDITARLKAFLEQTTIKKK